MLPSRFLKSSALFRVFCLFVGLSFLAACASSSSDDDGNESSGSSDTSGTSTLSLSTRCGAVVDNNIVNPITSAERVAVEVVSADTVIVTRLDGDFAGQQQVIKLHGISVSGVATRLVNLGVQAMSDAIASGGWLVTAGEMCDVFVEGGGQGIVGSVFTLTGESLAEIALELGAAIPSNDICGGELLVPCYSQIEIDEPISPLTISWFLWKPVSERDGNLVVLVDPFNVTVVAGGETLVDFGPSNDRGTTARSNRSGCAFGAPVTVEFFDSQGRRVFTNAGDPSITVPSGCDRLETRY